MLEGTAIASKVVGGPCGGDSYGSPSVISNGFGGTFTHLVKGLGKFLRIGPANRIRTDQSRT